MKGGKLFGISLLGTAVKWFCGRLNGEDLDDLLELINSLVEERADITRTKKGLSKEEIDWLSKGAQPLGKR